MTVLFWIIMLPCVTSLVMILLLVIRVKYSSAPMNSTSLLGALILSSFLSLAICGIGILLTRPSNSDSKPPAVSPSTSQQCQS